MVLVLVFVRILGDERDQRAVALTRDDDEDEALRAQPHDII
jgi:hypothetical protein